jgi:hypothetical protein
MRKDWTGEREFKETLRRAVKKFVLRSVFAYDGLFARYHHSYQAFHEISS